MEKFNSKPENLYVYIGPGISINNFEVGKDVYDLFDDDFKEVRVAKYYVDLKKDIYTRLIRMGVKDENVEVSEFCTFRDEELFHSYRRDREKSGRMLGVIGMKF
jgi:copper oxidase (laccase) domain-containing protein